MSTIYNWNVYKVFKNGKRAKTPFHVFEYKDPENVEEYFKDEIKEKFTEKIRAARLMILRSDLPQIRKAEGDDHEEKTRRIKERRVIGKYLNDDSFNGTAITCGLVLCGQSNWEWQWAVLESGTLRYLAGVSPSFKSHGVAREWMNEEINKL